MKEMFLNTNYLGEKRKSKKIFTNCNYNNYNNMHVHTCVYTVCTYVRAYYNYVTITVTNIGLCP